jgi:hypothetical protein
MQLSERDIFVIADSFDKAEVKGRRRDSTLLASWFGAGARLSALKLEQNQNHTQEII